jgi:hypothetical protein
VSHDETQKRLIAEQKLIAEHGIGATGDYPAGKADEHDEGGLKVAVGIEGDRVVTHFGKLVGWVSMTPEEALGYAKVLVARALALKPDLRIT